MHRCTNLWLDTGFVYFSYTITVVYSFLFHLGYLDVFFAPLDLFLQVSCVPQVTHSLEQIVGKDIDKSVSWRDFATALEVDLKTRM